VFRLLRTRRRKVGLIAGAVIAAVLPLAVVPLAFATEPHVDNPFAGAQPYVNPAWAANVAQTATQTTDTTLAAMMRTVAGYQTAVWLDRIATIAPTDSSMGLAAHLDAALAQQHGSAPVEIELVVYDLPGRDCAALASNGELPATTAGLDTYEHSYIDPIASIMAQSRYANLRIVTIVEPDSLPNIVPDLRGGPGHGRSERRFRPSDRSVT
jgi:cellulose 1,4-beta-cellobiosidase